MSSFKEFARQKVWVITGAASGIGLEMARKVLANGGVVWALDVDIEGLNSLETESKRGGYDLFTARVDVMDEKSVLSVMQNILTVSRRIDVWINNAGVQKVGAFATQPADQFKFIMKINFEAVVFATREILKHMENQGGGVILNMASVAGHVPAPFMTAYVASKHGVVGFTRALRAELQLLKSPVRCAMASPGFVDTKIIGRGVSANAQESRSTTRTDGARDAKFPEWLSWMLSRPESCAAEILEALAEGQDEIEPTINGKAMRVAFKLLPALTVRSSRVLLTRGLKDLVLNRYHVPQ